MGNNPRHVKREDRLSVEAAATVESVETGQSSQATSINMTSGGVLLHFNEAVPLAVGDTVSCDFLGADGRALPLPYWGLGKIVRVDAAAGNVAVDLQATGLIQLGRNAIVASIPVPDRL